MKETSNVPRVLLRREEIAFSLGISERLVQDWEKDFDLPAVRLGGCVRYHLPTVEQWAIAQGGRHEAKTQEAVPS